MHLTQLNRECLLHLFSFLEKDDRRSLSLTCLQLRLVFLDPCLWTLLSFSSLSQLRWDNFVLGPSLRSLSICWHSSRVLKVCNIEDWVKTPFQRDICAKHQDLVSDFLARVCLTCPNLRSLTLSGCAHVCDGDVVGVLLCCRGLRRLRPGELRPRDGRGPARRGGARRASGGGADGLLPQRDAGGAAAGQGATARRVAQRRPQRQHDPRQQAGRGPDHHHHAAEAASVLLTAHCGRTLVALCTPTAPSKENYGLASV